MEVAQGADRRFNLTLEFREAILGCTKKITIQHLEVCAACNGQGMKKSWRAWFTKAPSSICPTCNGDGRVSLLKTLSVTVPAGVDYGTCLCIPHEGDAGVSGGPPGDLYVFVFMPDALEWQRDGVNILSDLLIEPQQAFNGCSKFVETIDGLARLHIPPGTEHNQVLTLKGRGVPHLGKPKQRGDHLVTIKLGEGEHDLWPSNLEAEQYAEQGKQKLTTGNCLGAVADLTEAILGYPQRVDLYVHRGDAYHNLGGYDNLLKAVQDYTQALRLDPACAVAYCHRAYARQTLEDYQGAIADYTHGLELDLGYLPAYYQRGRAYYQTQAYEQAIADFNQAIRVSFEWGNVNPAEVYACRGLTYFAQEQFETAIADFTEALNLKGNYVEAYCYRAEAYVRLDCKPKAIADYQFAATLYQYQANRQGYQTVVNQLKQLGIVQSLEKLDKT